MFWQEQFDLEEFFTLPDCPFQRNTEQRLNRALRHLGVYHDVHCRVVVAEMVGTGARWLIDGHTRRLAWMRGLVKNMPPPAELILEADVHPVRSMDELEQLYSKFDSPLATESTRERLYGLARGNHLNFKSALLRAGRYNHALRRVWWMTHGYATRTQAGEDVRQAIKWLGDELRLFDRCDPPVHDFNRTFIAAALLTILRDGEGALDFWTRFCRNTGIKDDDGVDGVQAARQLMSHLREKKRNSTEEEELNIGRILNAYRMFKMGQRYTRKNGLPEPKSEAQIKHFVEEAMRAKAARPPLPRED